MPRNTVQTYYTSSHIMHTPVEKTIKILEKIIKGEASFIM